MRDKGRRDERRSRSVIFVLLHSPCRCLCLYLGLLLKHHAVFCLRGKLQRLIWSTRFGRKVWCFVRTSASQLLTIEPSRVCCFYWQIPCRWHVPYITCQAGVSSVDVPFSTRYGHNRIDALAQLMACAFSLWEYANRCFFGFVVLPRVWAKREG